MSDFSLLLSEVSLSSSDPLDSFSNFDKQNHTEAVGWRCSTKTVVLRNFAKFTGKHLHWSLFLLNFAGLRRATLLKMRLWHRHFPVNFVKFPRTPVFVEHVWVIASNHMTLN